MKTTQRAIALCLCMFMFICMTFKTQSPAVAGTAGNTRLAPCPQSPNCVSSSDPTDKHYLEPLRYTGSKEDAYQRLVTLIASHQRARIVAKEANYLKVEFRSAILRFVDDVEFFFPADRPVIEVRSASGVGYYDFGVNRRRVEDIRKQWNEEPMQ